MKTAVANPAAVQTEKRKASCAPSSGSARWTPTAGWVVKRAMKLAADRSDDVRVQDIEAAIKDVYRIAGAMKPTTQAPND